MLITWPALVAGGDSVRALRAVAPQLEGVADVGAVVVRAHVAGYAFGCNRDSSLYDIYLDYSYIGVHTAYRSPKKDSENAH